MEGYKPEVKSGLFHFTKRSRGKWKIQISMTVAVGPTSRLYIHGKIMKREACSTTQVIYKDIYMRVCLVPLAEIYQTGAGNVENGILGTVFLQIMKEGASSVLKDIDVTALSPHP